MIESKALKRLIRKITIETLWLYIAKVLINSNPMKAYEIKKKLYEVFNIKVPAITVYTVVYRMSREGLLESIKNNSDIFYRLSAKGENEFSKAIKILEEILAKLKN